MRRATQRNATRRQTSLRMQVMARNALFAAPADTGVRGIIPNHPRTVCMRDPDAQYECRENQLSSKLARRGSCNLDDPGQCSTITTSRSPTTRAARYVLAASASNAAARKLRSPSTGRTTRARRRHAWLRGEFARRGTSRDITTFLAARGHRSSRSDGIALRDSIKFVYSLNEADHAISPKHHLAGGRCAAHDRCLRTHRPSFDSTNSGRG